MNKLAGIVGAFVGIGAGLILFAMVLPQPNTPVMAEQPPAVTAQPSQREDCDWMYAKAKTAALREDINCSNCGNAKQSRMWSKLYLTCVERQNFLFPQVRAR